MSASAPVARPHRYSVRAHIVQDGTKLLRGDKQPSKSRCAEANDEPNKDKFSWAAKLTPAEEATLSARLGEGFWVRAPAGVGDNHKKGDVVQLRSPVMRIEAPPRQASTSSAARLASAPTTR